MSDIGYNLYVGENTVLYKPKILIASVVIDNSYI